MELIGKKFVNRFNSIYTVIEKIGGRYYIVEFDESKYRCKKRKDHIIKGEIKCPYDKTINNVCCIGEGKYKVWEDGKHTFEYSFYHNITTRCFNQNYKNSEKTYQDVTLCEEWYNFQNFAKWVEDNYYECNGEKMCIDIKIYL